MDLHSISDYINSNAATIVDNLEQESIDVYKFLKSEYVRTNVAENHVFQFVYRSFYRLDNAGVSAGFKAEYFNILEEAKGRQDHNLESILKRLYHFQNKKGQDSFQFSFVTKLLNTVDNNHPIYDSEVARVFGFKRPYQSSFGVKLAICREQLQRITHAYCQLLDQGLVGPALANFDLRFRDHGLSNMKRMDYIFWSAGKIMKKDTVPQRAVKPEQEVINPKRSILHAY